MLINKIIKNPLLFENFGVMINETNQTNNNNAANESESFNLLLNKPEAHALKSGHCMKEDCNICKALVNVEESQSSVVLPIPAKDCRDLKNDSNVSVCDKKKNNSPRGSSGSSSRG